MNLSHNPNDRQNDLDQPASSPQRERMWPLDVSIILLTALVIYILVKWFRFDDPRPLYNAWTYAIAVPIIALALALSMRNLASQHVQKSIQLGFLASLFVHLTLLLVAIDWVVIPFYFPDAVAGVQPERRPIRKTVSEYIFQSPQQAKITPDWSKPVDAETASRLIPEQPRMLPPIDQPVAKVELPSPDQPSPQPAEFLLRRELEQSTTPRPADAPSKLAKRSAPSPAIDAAARSADVPEISLSQAAAVANAADRSVAAESSRRSSTPTSAMGLAALAELAPRPTSLPTTSPQRRNVPSELPAVAGGQRSRDRRNLIDAPVLSMTTSPSVPTVAVARADADASRQLMPDRAGAVSPRRSRVRSSVMPDLSIGPSRATDEDVTSSNNPSVQRSSLAASGAMPGPISVPQIAIPAAVTGRSRAVPMADRGIAAVGTRADVPDFGRQSDAASPSPSRALDRGLIDPVTDLADRSTTRSADRRGSGASDWLGQSGLEAFSPSIVAPLGRVGLARTPAADAGLVPPMPSPNVTALDLGRDRRPKRTAGGPIMPAGDKVAAVQPFKRREMRTDGGPSQTPPGVVAPATEEAIELGLAFLADRQNDDGSWSLQGQGEDVILRSDSAATGLCLLAFQGAGYTHKRHQYAGVVAKGLDYLVSIQRTNGDLFRREDTISNRNVAFYSHGIAALALSEAYGMTQDPQLQRPAQMALDYIAATQHSRRGGWRYAPQISADTSVSGWMMMALKSGELSGLEVKDETYDGIDRWLNFAQAGPDRRDRYRYDPFAPDTPQQRHGRLVTPTMTAVGMLMRMYSGWSRDRDEMQSAADFLLQYPPEIGTPQSPQRDTYYWYYATQVMFHMGGDYWQRWNARLNPALLTGQIKQGEMSGSWHPDLPVPDRWSPHAGRLYVTTMNLLNLEVYYRHLPIYDDVAE